MIEFAGIRSDERYLIVEHYPQRFFPKRKYIVQTVPGGGDIVLSESDDAFSNYDQPYSVFFDSKGPGLSQASRKIAEWLLGNPGYQRLEDSYDPDFYRMAYCKGGEQFVNWLNEYGQGTLTFTCAPKRYYKSGEIPIIATKNMKLYSPSTFKSKPLIRITGSGSGEITITDKNGTAKTFAIGSLSGTTVIDSERHTAVRNGSTNVNNNVTSPYENLYLDSESTITWNNAISTLTITPRWWTI